MHFIAPIFLLVVVNQGLGYRYLWQDEIETAERARSILFFGYPKTIDSEGRLSLNSSGFELENSEVHRITPWGQFYWAAGGEALGKFLSWDRDRAVRFPFTVAHCLTSAILSIGLTHFYGLPVMMSQVVTTIFGLQSIRLIHNRTARYHALLDFILALSLLGLGCLKRNFKLGIGFILVGVFFAPHVQTLSGSLIAALTGFVALYTIWNADNHPIRYKVSASGLIVFTGLISLGLLVWLIELWIPRGIGEFSLSLPFRSLKSFQEISYSAIFFLLLSVWLAVKYGKKSATPFWISAGFIALSVRTLDFYSFSQTRYYLSLVIFFIFSPFILNWLENRISNTRAFVLLIFVTLLPEIYFWERLSMPFQGVAHILNDTNSQQKNEHQPFEVAINQLKADAGDQNTTILIDYVPQYVNWYFKKAQPALIPDPSSKNVFNSKHPIWQSPPILPQWHIWYPSRGSGFWDKINNSKFNAINSNHLKAGDRYQLKIKGVDKPLLFCVLNTWNTDHWNNAPFRLYERDSFRPNGKDGELVLAKSCQL